MKAKTHSLQTNSLQIDKHLELRTVACVCVYKRS